MLRNEKNTNTQNLVKPQRNVEQNVTAKGHLFYMIWPQSRQSFGVIDLGNAKLTQHCAMKMHA